MSFPWFKLFCDVLWAYRIVSKLINETLVRGSPHTTPTSTWPSLYLSSPHLFSFCNSNSVLEKRQHVPRFHYGIQFLQNGASFLPVFLPLLLYIRRHLAQPTPLLGSYLRPFPVWLDASHRFATAAWAHFNLSVPEAILELCGWCHLHELYPGDLWAPVGQWLFKNMSVFPVCGVEPENSRYSVIPGVN